MDENSPEKFDSHTTTLTGASKGPTGWEHKSRWVVVSSLERHFFATVDFNDTALISDHAYTRGSF